MTENTENPVRGKEYTLRQILKSLYLRDSPCLSFFHGEDNCVIQTSHVTIEQMLSIEGFADSEWKYLCETSEWVPVFRYVEHNTRSITDFVDIAPKIDYWSGEVEENVWWVTPKGFPRDQGRAE